MPSADEPALLLSEAERRAAVDRDRALARISTMFWGPRIPVDCGSAKRPVPDFAFPRERLTRPCSPPSLIRCPPRLARGRSQANTVGQSRRSWLPGASWVTDARTGATSMRDESNTRPSSTTTTSRISVNTFLRCASVVSPKPFTCPASSSRECLEVRPEQLGRARGLRCCGKGVQGVPSAAFRWPVRTTEEVAKRSERDLEADVPSVTEAVNDGLRRRGPSDWHALDHPHVDAVLQRETARPNELDLGR